MKRQQINKPDLTPTFAVVFRNDNRTTARFHASAQTPVNPCEMVRQELDIF